MFCYSYLLQEPTQELDKDEKHGTELHLKYIYVCVFVCVFNSSSASFSSESPEITFL